MAKPYSRYRKSILVKDETGDWIAPVTPFVDTKERRDDFVHIVEAGDRLDSLAWQYFANPGLWWVLAEYNDLTWFQNIEIGQALRIPSFETLNMELLR